MLRREREGIRYEWDRLILVWYGPRGLDELGGFEYRIRLPGYEELAGRAAVLPPSSGLRVEPLTARRLAEGFGELRLTAARVVPAGYVPAPSPLGALHLYPELGGAELVLDVSREPHQPQRLRGLPWGTYRAAFATADVATIWPETGNVPVAIGPEPAELVVDLTSTCTREVVVREAGKAPYSGRLTLRLDVAREEASSWAMHYVVRERGPYFLDGLRPGVEHSLRARLVPGYDASAITPVSFRPLSSSDPPVELLLQPNR